MCPMCEAEYLGVNLKHHLQKAQPNSSFLLKNPLQRNHGGFTSEEVRQDPRAKGY